MPTMRCRWCKRMITPSNGLCPHCRRTVDATGAPRRKPVALLLGIPAAIALLGLVALGVAGLGAYWLLVASSTTPAVPVAAPKKSAKPTAPPKEEPSRPPEKKDGKRESKPPPPAPSPPKQPDVPPADAKAVQALVETLLRQVNTYRKTAGLDLVQVDPELSRGCAAHAHYLALNPPTVSGMLLDEEPDKPGFSEAGRRAANFAMVSVGAARRG